MNNTTINLSCPAKVNLALSVGAPRTDGYHPIASWMVAIDLADQLTVGSAEQTTFDFDWAPDALRPTPIDWPLETDLIYRAHQLTEDHVGRLLPVQVKLRKRIPVGAGLAGGSTDGLGMFLALNRLFALKMTHQDIADLANQLGSDLAFFLHAPSAIVTGRGDMVSDAPLNTDIHLALILPDFGCPTGAVYRAFDQQKPHAAVQYQKVLDLSQQMNLNPAAPFNDLAQPAMTVQPLLATLHQHAQDAAGRTVHITGSGAGMFVIADDPNHAAELARAITRTTGCICIPTHVPNRPVLESHP